MTIYLDEGEFGDDGGCIGFPHIVLCMGLVVMTGHKIYGAHLGLPGTDSNTVVAVLGNLIAANHVPADMKALYGCCNRKVRYRGNKNKKNAWRNEMKAHAQNLGFNGSVYGFCTSIISPKNGTYVEYHPQYLQHKCKVFYKRHEKMNYVIGNASRNVQVYSRGRNMAVDFISSTTNASVALTSRNKGQLHEVNYFLRMSKFSV